MAHTHHLSSFVLQFVDLPHVFWKRRGLSRHVSIPHSWENLLVIAVRPRVQRFNAAESQGVPCSALGHWVYSALGHYTLSASCHRVLPTCRSCRSTCDSNALEPWPLLLPALFQNRPHSCKTWAMVRCTQLSMDIVDQLLASTSSVAHFMSQSTQARDTPKLAATVHLHLPNIRYPSSVWTQASHRPAQPALCDDEAVNLGFRGSCKTFSFPHIRCDIS